MTKNVKNKKKAGVILTGLMAEDQVQLNLFTPYNEDQKAMHIMRTLDAINEKWGRGTMSFAAAGLAKPWSMKKESLSTRYTSSWNELLVAKT